MAHVIKHTNLSIQPSYMYMGMSMNVHMFMNRYALMDRSVWICLCLSVQFSPLQSLSRVWHFATPWTTARQASLFITNSQSLPNSCPLRWWCHPTISSSVIPFSSRLQSFPASGSFQMFFVSGGQSIEVSASASVLPMNIQDWFPFGWTGWISLQSKGLSRVFSNTTVQKHQFLSTQFSL